MIKYLLIFALFVVAAQAKGNRCKSNSVCGENECCLAIGPRVGKCINRQKEGGECFSRERLHPLNEEIYMGDKCPCEVHLECRKVREDKQGKRCFKPGDTVEPDTSEETVEPEVPVETEAPEVETE